MAETSDLKNWQKLYNVIMGVAFTLVCSFSAQLFNEYKAFKAAAEDKIQRLQTDVALLRQQQSNDISNMKEKMVDIQNTVNVIDHKIDLLTDKNYNP